MSSRISIFSVFYVVCLFVGMVLLDGCCRSEESGESEDQRNHPQIGKPIIGEGLGSNIQRRTVIFDEMIVGPSNRIDKPSEGAKGTYQPSKIKKENLRVGP